MNRDIFAEAARLFFVGFGSLVASVTLLTAAAGQTGLI
jgi:hypothetical protein